MHSKLGSVIHKQAFPRMRSVVNAALAVVALCWCSAAPAESPPSVRWIVFDFPPFFIEHGPAKGQGIYDRFLNDLKTELPGFDHRLEPGSPNRGEALMKRGEPVCAISRIRTTEREAYSLFADHPYLYILPVELVAGENAQGTLSDYVEDGRLSLTRVLQADAVRIGVIENRRFGQPLDSLIEGALDRHAPSIVSWPADSPSFDALKLITSGRFDAAFVYPSELSTIAGSQRQTRFATYLLREMPSLVPASVSCTHSAVGRAVIAAVDKLPRNRKSVRNLQAAYEALLPSDARDTYRRLLARELQK